MIRLAATYGAVASTGAAAWVGWGQGQGQLAGAVILAAIAFLAFRFWILGGVDLGARLPRRDTVASILLVGMIVTAGMVGPMSQTTAASSPMEECNPLDNQVSYLMKPLASGASGIMCVVETTIGLSDYEKNGQDQAEVDVYQQLSSEKQSTETYESTTSNYLNDSETVAWSKMQVAVAEAYQNGSTKAEAKTAARKAIHDYYAVKHRNIVARWNTQAAQVDYAANLTNPSGDPTAGESFVQFKGLTGTSGSVDGITGNKPVVLANGTTVNASIIGSGRYGTTVDGFTSTYNGNSADAIQIDKPTSSYGSDLVLSMTKFHDLWNQVSTKSSSVSSEAEAYVDATYADYEDGTINASDVISSQTAMFEYGTQYDENSSMYDAVGALALSGYDTPSLNGTGTMDIRYQNQTYTGLVMARDVPGGSWTNGTTYNTSNFTGPVFVATTDGTKMDLADGDTFTITEIRNREGSSIGSVNATRYNYKTANASELAVVTEQLTALREEIESRESTGGGGGFDFGGDNSYVIVIAAGVAVLLLLRD
jgi:uncharacterized protein YaiE (UPF0345 family)